MAASQAQIGYGTLLKRGNGASPEVFTPVAEITSITPPQAESDDVEVTHMESPGRTKEYIAGMVEAGEAAFKGNWIPGNATQDHLVGVLADQKAGTVRNWQIVVPPGTAAPAGLTWSFSGYVKKFNPDISVSDKLSFDASIKVSGASTYA